MAVFGHAPLPMMPSSIPRSEGTSPLRLSTPTRSLHGQHIQTRKLGAKWPECNNVVFTILCLADSHGAGNTRENVWVLERKRATSDMVASAHVGLPSGSVPPTIKMCS